MFEYVVCSTQMTYCYQWDSDGYIPWGQGEDCEWQWGNATDAGRSHHDSNNMANTVHPDYIHTTHIHTNKLYFYSGCKIINYSKEIPTQRVCNFVHCLWARFTNSLRQRKPSFGIKTVLSGFTKDAQWRIQPRLIGNTCLYIHFCNTVIMYLAARFAAVSKWNVQRVALKYTFNTWPWHVFITLVQARIAVFLLCCLRYVLPPFIIQISSECR